MKLLLFAASLAAVPVLGFGAAFHRSVRSLPLPARLPAALGLGYVSLTVTAVLLSTARISWSIPALALPPLAVSCALWIAWRGGAPPARRRFRPSASAAVLALVAGGLGALHLIAALITAAGTSTDFLLFWGVKAARFAEARSIDAALLQWPYFSHAVPDYPPAVPVVAAWSVLWTGELSWRLMPLTTALCALAAAPLLLELLRRVSTDDHAAAVTAFWLSALCISLARSLSGGSAEAPLLFFETVAVAALLMEPPEQAAETPSQFLPALMLAGAALTKVEGSVAVLLVAAGALARDLADHNPGRRRPWAAVRRTARLLVGAAAAIATWFLFQATHGLRTGFRTHGDLWSLHPRFLPEILRSLLRNLDAGTLGLSWLVPLILLVASRPRVRALLPALTVTVGILVFLVFDYLHDDRSPSERIRWTAPRVSQPALSALILAAGVATSRKSERAAG